MNGNILVLSNQHLTDDDLSRVYHFACDNFENYYDTIDFDTPETVETNIKLFFKKNMQPYNEEHEIELAVSDLLSQDMDQWAYPTSKDPLTFYKEMKDYREGLPWSGHPCVFVFKDYHNSLSMDCGFTTLDGLLNHYEGRTIEELRGAHMFYFVETAFHYHY